jgi:hypothetical protein
VFGPGEGNFKGHPLTPLYVLANQLIAFKSPQGKGWNSFLDVIEAAAEEASQASDHPLPLLAYQYLKK